MEAERSRRLPQRPRRPASESRVGPVRDECARNGAHDPEKIDSYRFKDTGGAGTHTRQTQEPHKPTSKPTPPTDSRARPRPNPGTHASPHTTPLSSRTHHPIKRGGGDGDGDGARTWEQRGREPDGIGDGTPPRTGRRGGSSFNGVHAIGSRRHDRAMFGTSDARKTQ